MALTTQDGSAALYGTALHSPFASMFMALAEPIAGQFVCVQRATVRTVTPDEDDGWLWQVLKHVEQLSGYALLASRRWAEAASLCDLGGTYRTFAQNKRISHLVLQSAAGRQLVSNTNL